MSIHVDIRSALTDAATGLVGFPDDVHLALEGAEFQPLPGAPWARLTVMPVRGRPFGTGADINDLAGMFQVDWFVLMDGGLAAAELAADTVRAGFVPGTHLMSGGARVLIEYSRREQVLAWRPEWICCPVTVGWRCLSAS